MSVIVITQIRAIEGKSQEVQDVIRLGKKLAQNPGLCSMYEILQERDDPNLFNIYEVWLSSNAHKKFVVELINTPGVVEKMKDFESEPTTKYFDVL